MFDIGFAELLLIAVVGLLVIGPERLPSAIRTASLWLGRLRRSFSSMKQEIEREIGADEIRRQLHNESVMASLNESKDKLQGNLNAASDELRLLEQRLSPSSDTPNQEEEAAPSDALHDSDTPPSDTPSEESSSKPS
ncbi:Sec-independent protein translocase protein TatB [Spongiibacter sp.]|uniref:Sec-independent protein translocase protein TatB n=1 Tax=Spongiibacter sp. TaxID=2024860 RepID=UPI000C3B4A3F|nr:Sec-independent protein translocase protein TatB [Spongiibacter sp.]MBU73691.1 twin-arginine translocase subunit TatB [Spongiibacter sp.]